jgi:tRNA nucleotidyltransferase/poly(A) polymerase
MEDTSVIKFDRLLTSDLKIIIEILQTHQKLVYIVGGAIRDFFFKRPIKDIDFDIATNATPEEITDWMSEEGIKVKPIGGKYGTLLVIVKKKAFEVSTFRREAFKTLGEPPRVFFVDTIEEDLNRRDFKFNAIVYDVSKRDFSDKFNGMQDIQLQRISMIGNAEDRFKEDGLRIIRLARFASKYNLTISQDIITAIEKIGRGAKFRSHISLQNEFFKLLLLPNPTFGLKLLFDYKVLEAIFPDLPYLKVDSSAKSKIMKYLDRFEEIPSRTPMVRLFSLLLILSRKVQLTEELLVKISKDLELSKKAMQSLVRLLQSWTNFPQDYDSKMLKRWVRATGINTSEDLLPFILINAKILRNEKIVLKEKFLVSKIQKIIQSFRNKGKSH